MDHNNAFMNVKRKFLGMSLSELAGNISFVCVTTAYMSTDILLLRVLATASTLLSIAFQFYRASPLWIPIRWNFLLLGINSVMISNLLVEYHRAHHMPAELKALFREANFEKRGFSPVEFNKLFRAGKQKRYPKGTVLTRDGKENNKL